MTTNLAESINSVLKKFANSPLVKSTHLRFNALFNKRGREANAYIYTILIKVIEDAQRKANAYTVIEFDRCDTWFLILETINPKERGLLGELRNEAYWSSYHEPVICPKLYKKSSTKDHLVSSCIYTEMDILESSQPK
ncbi:hypothetical protein GmHk_01G001019 [Glycine max]|nr:hypothetical protein GmHk_01G001019 [Glycine max]